MKNWRLLHACDVVEFRERYLELNVSFVFINTYFGETYFFTGFPLTNRYRTKLLALPSVLTNRKRTHEHGIEYLALIYRRSNGVAAIGVPSDAT